MEVDEPILDAVAALAQSGTAEATMPVEGASTDLGNMTIFAYEMVEGENRDEMATRLAQELITQIFALPVQPSDVGPLALLPHPKTPIPREKSVPQAPVETKWQKYARENGLKLRKKESKIWDEETQQMRPTWGRFSTKNKDEWVMEHKEGMSMDGFEDPFIQKKTLKKQRIEANEKKRLANKRNATIQQGKDRMGSINSSSLVIGSTAPTAGPVSQERIKRAIQLAQRSTRSLGIHDTKRPDEPRNKMAKKVLPKSEGEEKFQTQRLLKRALKSADKEEYDREKMANQQIQEERNVMKRKRAHEEEQAEAEKRRRKMK